MATSSPVSVKVHVFSDFDGTLCYDDTGVLLIDDPRSLGSEKRKQLDKAILNGQLTYRDGVKSMWDSVTMTMEEAWTDHLDKARVDRGFPEFHKYCQNNDIPITVVSSGLYPLLERMMIKFLGENDAKDIKIISNDVHIDGRNWNVQWHDDSPYGNDKSKALQQARENSSSDTIFIFCGDGISDISAAKHADVLFARKGRDLEIHCHRESIPFIPFDSFDDILVVLNSLVTGKVRLERDPSTGFCRIE
ncbi:HAD-like domain-containing protein [Halteromyces radiatus]|uniref:HAD-like domain-containing protein n=1 Tax=Halteromyces radiatus TaxID=101107 RepID=UPI00221E7416|nr:HAD-like domain-containing protein [Halteromyces radiatus]KAI8081316.1 HAD-like domain-containing protein [Halteromyces radiatus]